jgi:anthranilate phosphoribosyltransferase
LKGGDVAQNADAIRAFLRGEKNAYRDIVLFNAAAALIVAGKAGDLKQGIGLSAGAVDGRAALNVLEKLVKLTN